MKIEAGDHSKIKKKDIGICQEIGIQVKDAGEEEIKN